MTYSLLTLILLLAPDTPVVQLSPAARRMEQARTEIAKTPGRADPHNALATALLRRARETGDTGFLSQATAEVDKSLALQKDNYGARKVEAGILLASHEYTRAKEAASALNKRNMDDIEVYGLLADAAGELGDYKTAEEAAQWMLDLRPADYRSLEHGAHFREVFGNPSGAADLWTSALRQVTEGETEERAWILVNLSGLYLRMQNPAAAEKTAAEALKAFPAYPLAAVAMAHVRVAQQNFAAAAALLKALPNLPLAEQYTLAMALEKSGNADAAAAFKAFETAARAAMDKPDNANLELAAYLPPAQALPLVRAEASRRQDARTLDTLASTLDRSGDHLAAQAIRQKLLAAGVTIGVTTGVTR